MNTLSPIDVQAICTEILERDRAAFAKNFPDDANDADVRHAFNMGILRLCAALVEENNRRLYDDLASRGIMPQPPAS